MTRHPMPTVARVAVRTARLLVAMLCAAGAAMADPATDPATDPTTDPEVRAAVEAIIAGGNLSLGAAAMIAGLSGASGAAAPTATSATTSATIVPAPLTLAQAGNAAAPPRPDTAAALAGLRRGPAPVLSLPADIVALSAVTVTPEPPAATPTTATPATAPAMPLRPLTIRMGATATTAKAPPVPIRPFIMPWSTGVYR